MVSKDIGTKIRNHRELKLAMTQKEFADEAKISVRSLSDYELGKKIPRGIPLGKLMKRFPEVFAPATVRQSAATDCRTESC